MLSHILVAIDQSASSQRAFETALDLAKALEAKLTLVHVLDVFDPASPERPKMSGSSYSIELDNLLRDNYERQWAEFATHYDSLLKQKQEKAEAIAVSASCLQPYGRPGPAICKAAREGQAELIVVGSHGRKGLSEMILGSVSNYIVHHAPCSVMVIHPDSRRHPRSLAEPSELRSAVMS
ncbi:MAG: universal stress protein [Leptolyngbya sp. SIO1D8]|nr:universal stress protein [Leptolyngbya sp. SIO1D8]